MNDLVMTVPFVVSILSGAVSILAILNFIHARRQEREERRREAEKNELWKQSVNDQLERLTKRVDSHNRYAEMFRKYGEDIAFIRGKLE